VAAPMASQMPSANWASFSARALISSIIRSYLDIFGQSGFLDCGRFLSQSCC
jgi:hypothetical protein